MATTAVKKKTGSMKAQHVVSRVLIYALLIVVAALMLIPFLWMLSASFKLNKDVFTFPIEWIPSNPRPQNYVDIWTKIPLLTFVKNTAFLTIVVTILQVLTSSFAAYAFAKLNFKGKNVLFLGYIATIAVPWQAFMIWKSSKREATRYSSAIPPCSGKRPEPLNWVVKSNCHFFKFVKYDKFTNPL